MKRSPLPLVVALVVAGCSGPDPATSRLKLGDEVIVRCPAPDPNRPPAPKVKLFDGSEVDEYPVHADRVTMRVSNKEGSYLGPGDKVRVVADEAPSEIREADKAPLADLDGRVDRRPVRVKVLDGQSRERTGELPRNALRPIR